MADNGNNSPRTPVNHQQQYWAQQFSQLKAQHNAQIDMVRPYQAILNEGGSLSSEQTQSYANATQELLRIEQETNRWIGQGWQDPNVVDLLIDNPNYREYEVKEVPAGDYIYNNTGERPQHQPQTFSGQAGRFIDTVVNAGQNALDAAQSALGWTQDAGREAYRAYQELDPNTRLLAEEGVETLIGGSLGRILRVPGRTGDPLRDRLNDDITDKLGGAAIDASSTDESALEPQSDASDALNPTASPLYADAANYIGTITDVPARDAGTEPILEATDAHPTRSYSPSTVTAITKFAASMNC